MSISLVVPYETNGWKIRQLDWRTADQLHGEGNADKTLGKLSNLSFPGIFISAAAFLRLSHF